MSLLTARRLFLHVGFYALFALIVMIESSMIGAEEADPLWATQWLFSAPPNSPRPVDVDIFYYLRLPRILMAFMAGATLALVGAVFQALLRNPLATPYTLGVASGGAFGAVAALFLPIHLPWIAFGWGPFSHVQCLAFGGAMLAVGLIWMLARGGGRVSTMELLLAGVTLGMIFSALILAIRYFTDPQHLVGMDRWMMGGLDVDGYRDVLAVLVFMAPAVAILLALGQGLDQISFGEQMALGRGVNVARLQKVGFLGGSLAVAAVVAATGPIGFIGLIVPHTMRRLVGPDHRLLLPCVFFAGGGFLVVCDTFARTIIAPTELPVGIVTALLGGPFFIYLLIHGRRTGKLWGSEE